jgi:hypothetical protein
MRNVIIFAVVIVLSVWAVIHMTILSNSAASKEHSPNHATSEKYLNTLLDQASTLLSRLSEVNMTSSPLSHTASAGGGEHLKGHSHADHHKLTQQLVQIEIQRTELKHALEQCEMKTHETLTDSHTNHQLAVTHTTSPTNPNKWLVIGIPTVHRTNNEDYLLKTLRAMSKQLPLAPSDLLYGKILIVVVNVQDNPTTHSRYFEAKKEFLHANNPKSIYFEFHDSLGPDVNPLPGKFDAGTPNKPGAKVRRQTRDIAKVVKLSINKGQYYLFSEDDMVLCPAGLTTMQYMLTKATAYHPDWLAIRASYGISQIEIMRMNV